MALGPVSLLLIKSGISSLCGSDLIVTMGGEVTTDAGGEKRGKAGSSTAREAVIAG